MDRGASIAAFSQYPQEEEVLWAPLAFVAPEGPPRLEVTPQGVVRVVPVRATAGTGSGTVEQIRGRWERLGCSGEGRGVWSDGCHTIPSGHECKRRL